MVRLFAGWLVWDLATSLGATPVHGPEVLDHGEASYYAKRLHGRKTASGERYNHQAYTAAHPSLPLGTWVKVWGPDQQRSVAVRINDRMPGRHGRVIDLSGAAAKALGLGRQGLAHVVVLAHAETP